MLIPQYSIEVSKMTTEERQETAKSAQLPLGSADFPTFPMRQSVVSTIAALSGAPIDTQAEGKIHGSHDDRLSVCIVFKCMARGPRSRLICRDFTCVHYTILYSCILVL